MVQTLNIAHRGGAGLWPENTLFAFASAASAGFDGAELDVQLTRDEKLVVFHDFHLNPELCRDSAGQWLEAQARPRIRELSLGELQSFDVGRPRPGSHYARRHPELMPRDGERIPSLSQVIDAVRTFRSFQLFVELKTDPGEPSAFARPEALAEAIIAELKAHDFVARSILVGFDWRGLAHVKRIAPAAACWLTTKPRASVGAEQVKGAGAKGWFCPTHRATSEAVAAARALGLSFGVWTVDDARSMRRLIGYGVDAICTNRPDRLQSLL